MEKYLVVIFHNLDRLRYDLTRVAYPRYFGRNTAHYYAPRCTTYLRSWRSCSLGIVLRGSGTRPFPEPVKRLRKEGGTHRLSISIFCRNINGTFGMLLTTVSPPSSLLTSYVIYIINKLAKLPRY